MAHPKAAWRQPWAQGSTSAQVLAALRPHPAVCPEGAWGSGRPSALGAAAGKSPQAGFLKGRRKKMPPRAFFCSVFCTLAPRPRQRPAPPRAENHAPAPVCAEMLKKTERTTTPYKRPRDPHPCNGRHKLEETQQRCLKRFLTCHPLFVTVDYNYHQR